MTTPPSACTTAVFFDCAGTLFDDRALRDVHLRQLRHLAELCGLNSSDAELRAAYRQGLGKADLDVAGRSWYLHRELFGAAFAAMARVMGASVDPAHIEELVERQCRATVEGAQLRHDCVDTLHRLRQLGMHVQIVSNIDTDQLDELIDKFDLGSMLDETTSSEESRSCKPDPGIYRFALAKADRDAESVLFVGDSVAHDVDAPAALGMRTAWLVTDPAKGEADTHAGHVIRSLSAVLDLIHTTGARVRS
jgi:HAD superfamily hydrolase (TIGR01509 family)